ncbi:MAG: ATP-binding protein, partial [Symploca sp. SIO1B1]|nr:ATP-binding protein [Symploca sp. SIO1B1]
LPISAKAVQQAVTKARNIYSNSVDDHQWIELAQVYRSKLTRNNDLHRSLLFNRCILEYRHSDDQGNIQLWRDVHPLLKSTKEFQAALKELQHFSV